jgi:hypothetical protein
MKTIGIVCASLLAVGCTEELELSSNNEAPTFDVFKAEYAHQLEDGSWIVNGDEPIRDEDELLEFYYAVFSNGELIVNTVGGQDDAWSASQAQNLTYCVSNKFGGSKSAIANAVAAGANMWEGAAAVNFVYLSEHDGNCNVRNNGVVFSVEPTNDPNIYARAFFPSYNKKKRNVLVNAAATLSNNDPYQAKDILGHELGHTLGFRHEHTRPEAGSECFENNSWRALTPYDNASIMHYPWCGNADPNQALTWSQLDAQGAAALY